MRVRTRLALLSAIGFAFTVNTRGADQVVTDPACAAGGLLDTTDKMGFNVRTGIANGCPLRAIADYVVERVGLEETPSARPAPANPPVPLARPAKNLRVGVAQNGRVAEAAVDRRQ